MMHLLGPSGGIGCAIDHEGVWERGRLARGCQGRDLADRHLGEFMNRRLRRPKPVNGDAHLERQSSEPCVISAPLEEGELITELPLGVEGDPVEPDALANEVPNRVVQSLP